MDSLQSNITRLMLRLSVRAISLCLCHRWKSPPYPPPDPAPRRWWCRSCCTMIGCPGCWYCHWIGCYCCSCPRNESLAPSLPAAGKHLQSTCKTTEISGHQEYWWSYIRLVCVNFALLQMQTVSYLLFHCSVKLVNLLLELSWLSVWGLRVQTFLPGVFLH